jgi:two-component system response regulator PilR (NtrC family)
VVDDEALIRWSVAETLSAVGMEVSQAYDGVSALRLLVDGSRPFRVIVLDFRLPDVKDLSFLARVRQITPTSAVILMTAFGTPEVSAGAVELGVFQILHKPFELIDLATLVKNACADPPEPAS